MNDSVNINLVENVVLHSLNIEVNELLVNYTINRKISKEDEIIFHLIKEELGGSMIRKDRVEKLIHEFWELMQNLAAKESPSTEEENILQKECSYLKNKPTSLGDIKASIEMEINDMNDQ